MTPLISIITVTYNSGPLLEATLKSVLSQKDLDIEYFIIDGASTDDTLEILAPYRDNIDCIVSESDNGIYDAMNKGVSRATGHYLMFINAGDTLCDNAIEKIREELRSALDIYYFAYYNLTEIKGQKFLFEGPKCLILSHEIPTCHNAMVISRKAFKDCGLYDTKYRLSADYEWLCRNRDKLKGIHCNKKIIYSLLGGVSEVSNMSVLIEKACIAKRYFGWNALPWHIIRFIEVAPLSGLKWVLIKVDIFDFYLSLKYMLKSRKTAKNRDMLNK